MSKKKAEYNLPEDRAAVDIKVTTKGFSAHTKGLEKTKAYFDKKRYFDIKENGVKVAADVTWLEELDVPLIWQLELSARFFIRYGLGLVRVSTFIWGYLVYRIRKVVK